MFTIPLPILTIIPSNSIQGAMVGSPQDIQCIVSTVSGVELSSVMISWMGPGGESIINDSRVTIIPTTSSGNNYTSSLQFTYLMEGDDGMYTINVMILDTTISKIIQLNSIICKSCYSVYNYTVVLAKLLYSISNLRRYQYTVGRLIFEDKNF